MAKGYTSLQKVSLYVGATIALPPALTGAALSSSGGTGLALGTTYGYALAYVPTGGTETGPSPVSSVTTAGSGSTQSIALTFAAAPDGVAQVRLYRQTNSGAFALLASLAATATAYTDTGAITPSGTPTGSGPASALPADQQYHVTSILLDAIEAYIDTQTRRTWLAPAITGERYDVKGPVIFLRQRPIASIQKIHVRTAQVGDPGRDLVAGSDYELLDANLGQVRMAGSTAVDQLDNPGPEDTGTAVIAQLEGEFATALAFVDYTPVGPPVPADISLTATVIVAATLRNSLNADRWGVSSAQADRETVIKYTQDGTEIVVPEMAQRVLDRYALPIIV